MGSGIGMMRGENENNSPYSDVYLVSSLASRCRELATRNELANEVLSAGHKTTAYVLK